MTAPSLNWRHRGACRGEDPELFFGPEDEPAPDRHAREARAGVVCRYCPVKRQCGQHAVTAPEKWGVWGGIGEADRVHVRRNYLRHLKGYAA
jgi:WhiB family redox-sensing transcriptional regulator